MSIVVDLKRLDLAETVQFPFCVWFQLIVACIRTGERDVRIVDPVLLLRAVNGLFLVAAVHVRTLKLLRMSAGEVDHIARHNTVRADLKTDL